MKATIELNREDITRILAENFGVEESAVTVDVRASGRLFTGLAKAVGTRPVVTIEQEGEAAMNEGTAKTQAEELADKLAETAAASALPFTMEEEPEPAAEEPKKPLSRAERMFGKREEWSKAQDKPEQPEDDEDMDIMPVKGFVILKCPGCGRIKQCFFKAPQGTNLCYDCGTEYVTDYRKMKPAYADCPSCENRTIRYMTNLTAEFIEISCNQCGAPIDLELDKQGKAYKTVGKGGRRE